MLAVARDGVKTRNLRWKGTAIIPRAHRRASGVGHDGR